MSSLPMIKNRVDNIVDSNKTACGLFSSSVYVDKAALKLLMDDCLKKKAELARCEMEKEIYKEKAREANEKLRSATEQLERLAKIVKNARYSINTDKATPTSAYKDLALLREMSVRCTMYGDSKRQDSTLQKLARAQKIRNSMQVKKIDMIEAEIHRLKDEINRVNKGMLKTREVIGGNTTPPMSDDRKIFESVELRSEIKELSNQLRIAKDDVEKRKKDIELVKSLLSQIRNNSVKFSNMVMLD
ncbi:uncharacterized protein LOC106668306 [Cimex lectularius]|uniref:Uncharacterized protein n=1 Tax=Cimex lectularius TaxID=79782 RepID=A0A8I6TFK0_CIMLE|nr:uncharacterized protein LOC106668306 [Cimex lectularius]